MSHPLMPKATAVWLVENTTLTFAQIAEFAGLHPLEVQAIADGEVAVGIVGQSPVTSGQLTQAELDRCLADPEARLKMLRRDLPSPVKRTKGPRYTPIARRGDKPDAIAWLVKNHPELSDAEICRLVGTTKPTIARVRERGPGPSNDPSGTSQPRSPVMLDLCSQPDLDMAVERAKARSAGKAARG